VLLLLFLQFHGFDADWWSLGAVLYGESKPPLIVKTAF
jgi:hypothetical protein